MGNKGSAEVGRAALLLSWPGRSPGTPAACVSSEPFSSASVSASDGPGSPLFVSVGCKASLIPSSCPTGAISGSEQQAGSGLNAQVALILAKWSLECLIKGRTMFGAHTGASHLCLGPAWARGEPEGLCLSASVGQRRGVPHGELHLLVVAVSHSSQMPRDGAMLY